MSTFNWNASSSDNDDETDNSSKNYAYCPQCEEYKCASTSRNSYCDDCWERAKCTNCGSASDPAEYNWELDACTDCVYWCDSCCENYLESNWNHDYDACKDCVPEPENVYHGHTLLHPNFYRRVPEIEKITTNHFEWLRENHIVHYCGWEFNKRELCPPQLMADFYLLEGMLCGAVNDVGRYSQTTVTFRPLASELLRDIDRLAPQFRNYALMAIGGEFRYHIASRDLHGLSEDYLAERTDAWRLFCGVYKLEGPEILPQIATRFLECAGSYGGRPWADACYIVYEYENQNISSHVFMDRIFNLQHNSGSFLNKVSWYVPNDDTHKYHISYCIAIGAIADAVVPDWWSLRNHASKPVRELLDDYWKDSNRSRRIILKDPVPLLPAQRIRKIEQQRKAYL